MTYLFVFSNQMTSADGTTFIIAYQYANEGEGDDLSENPAKELVNQPTQSTPIANDEQSTKQAPVGNLGADVDRDFLRNFLSGRECLPGGTGWWRYEICYGKHVIQFHVNSSKELLMVLRVFFCRKKDNIVLRFY